eukprot:m.126162 g.126162  ORF g.126162 m.126162 type:complete len:178 (-) comp15767_c0_seq4:1335-1868(-)
MLRCHTQLRTNHHLPHNSRIVYVLFLKGAGLSMDESIHFFLSEYRQGMSDADVRRKRYDYSIRHLYGKEGSRIDRTPFGCDAIIADYDCPFKTHDDNALRNVLEATYAAASGEASEAFKQARAEAAQGHYKEACQCTFKGTLLTTTNLPAHQLKYDFTSPNEYLKTALALSDPRSSA